MGEFVAKLIQRLIGHKLAIGSDIATALAIIGMAGVIGYHIVWPLYRHCKKGGKNDGAL